MSKGDFRITIADVPNREEPVCEIYYKEMGWVEIYYKEMGWVEIYYKEMGWVEISYKDNGKFIIVFFNKNKETFWEFSYEEAMEVLQEAKSRLTKMQRTPEQQAGYEARMEELENWKPTPEETAEYERKMEEQRKKYYG